MNPNRNTIEGTARKLFILAALVLAATVTGKAQRSMFVGDDPCGQVSGEIRLVLATEYRDNQVTNVTVCRFGSRKQITERIVHSNSIEPHSDRFLDDDQVTTYHYDDNAVRLVKTVTLDPQLKRSVYTNYIYDSQNRLAEEIFFDHRNQVVSKTRLNYPEGGKLVQATIYLLVDGKESRFRSRTFEYNKQQLLIKRIDFNRKGQQDQLETYEYDGRRFLHRRAICCDNSRSSRSIFYKFDERGNWVDRIESDTEKSYRRRESGKNVVRVHRVIDYGSPAN